MSTIRKIIDRVNENKPNVLSESTMVAWLAELDGKIAMDVLLLDIVELPQYQYDPATDMDRELLVRFPHDAIYYYWLCAKIDAENGEYKKYQNTMQLYNASYSNFVNWFLTTYAPTQGGCCRKNVPTHYISAYGLAVQKGYAGTLDEWLASLKGEPGERGAAFQYEDFTEEQLAALIGPQGPAGIDGKDGTDGERGPGVLAVSVAPSVYTTAIGDYTPRFRIAISIVTSHSGVEAVLVGDLIQHSYYLYFVSYVDDQYAYISSTPVSIRGATGQQGAPGADGEDGEDGEDGKTAYQYAQDGGFKGTEADFARQMAEGGAEVVVSSEAPTEETAKIWVNPDEEDEGGTSIDVTAEVGQTIRVKAVDENGKPTEWEAVDYQKKICGDELGYIIPETTVEGSSLECPVDELLVNGETYVVNWEGVDYTCVCQEITEDGMTFQFIGNAVALGGESTGEPFFFVTTFVDGNKVGLVSAIDVSVTSITFSLTGKKATAIPAQYVTNAFPYYIEVTGSGTDDDPYVCNDTVANVEAIFRSGRQILARVPASFNNAFMAVLNLLMYGQVDSGYGLGFIFSATDIFTSNIVRLAFIPQEDGTYAVEEVSN